MGGMIAADQRAALLRLAPLLPAGAYLAGGVAIAATLQHRTSHDLDIFVPGDFDPERVAERITAAVEPLTITGSAPGTLYLVIDGVPVSIIAYRYPLLDRPERNGDLGVLVASLEDLACMKLAAIASRGMARDFWDLDALLGHGVAGGDLRKALDLHQRKYAADDIGHVVRSLVYFGDADAAPLPRGLSDADWGGIKHAMEERVRALD